MKKATLVYLDMTALTRGTYQPRHHFDKTALNELALSIKEQGLIEPLVVRPVSTTCYEIIAGERRWRAAQIAGLETLPCLVNHYNDEQAAAVTLIENIQRENLNTIEEARGFKRLLDEFFFQHDDVAKMVGKSRTYVTNMVRLLTLDKKVQDALIDKQLTVGHAKMLVGFSANEQYILMQKVIKNDWSVRRLEKQVRQLKSKALSPKKDRDVARLEQLIAEACGTRAEIEQDAHDGGWLKVKFFDNDTLAGLLDKLGVCYKD